jgi:hypothetical protein
MKGLWLPALLAENPKLSASQKLLIALVDSLTTDKDPCYASHEFLAKRLGLSASRVGHLILEMTKAGQLVTLRNGYQVTGRVVAPAYSAFPKRSKAHVGNDTRAMSKTTCRHVENDKGGCRKRHQAHVENDKTPHVENDIHIIQNGENMFNKTSDRTKEITDQRTGLYVHPAIEALAEKAARAWRPRK